MRMKLAATMATVGMVAFAAPAAAGDAWVMLHAPGDTVATIDCVGFQDYDAGEAVLACADRWDRSRIILKSQSLADSNGYVRSKWTYYFASGPLAHVACTNEWERRVIFKVDGSLREGTRWDYVGSYRC